jgi:hypothetical protein
MSHEEPILSAACGSFSAVCDEGTTGYGVHKMTNLQDPGTVAEAQQQMTDALNNLVNAFGTFIGNVITDPELIFSAGDLISEVSSATPAIVDDIVGISVCATDIIVGALP